MKEIAAKPAFNGSARDGIPTPRRRLRLINVLELWILGTVNVFPPKTSSHCARFPFQKGLTVR